MRIFLSIVVIVFLFTACDFFNSASKEEPVARINNTYLYKKDIEGLINETTSKEDSTIIINNYINRWATQQLLINQANINLPVEQLATYNRLVEDYKNDLLTEAYKGAVASKQLDSVISEKEYSSYYESNKENFRLKESLYKLRYLHLNKKFANISETKQQFNRFNKEDKLALSNASLQFKSQNLNDSVWVKKEALLKQLPVIQMQNESVLNKSQFSQLEDSLGVYLIKINGVLEPNDIAPLAYIKPTITQIILSKRKLELIKKLERDITKDAIKNKKFEIYTPQ
ncbi:MAG: peptidyl-prolyl cis-trans isomerase [Patiriisocius sp.]|uniref:peptidyl-prolyl cis-trans isomerase n=1 Tax=Patiriisocius sp. TaxID=2822396 RepID=UPI003EF9671A